MVLCIVIAEVLFIIELILTLFLSEIQETLFLILFKTHKSLLQKNKLKSICIILLLNLLVKDKLMKDVMYGQ